MTRLQAVIWDVDGTLAETERDGHRVAFNRAFEEHGVPWRWSDAHYADLLRVTGGRERLLHDMSARPDAPRAATEREALARAVHARKNELYAALVGSAAIPLRGGVLALMADCREHGVRMAIATTTSRSNVDALLRMHLGGAWQAQFAAVVCGGDVQRKKPDPEVYVTVLRALGLGPLETVAIEDSPGGVAAAHAADVPVVVTRSAYFSDSAVDGAVAIGPGLDQRSGWRPALGAAPDGVDRVRLDDLQGWCEQMDLVSHVP